MPWIGIEDDYLPDVLSQEMGLKFEDITLRAGVITMRSFVLFLFEWLQNHTINNSTQYQAYIPYKFNTFNPSFPGSTCGLPSPLINGEQQRFCNALAPWYYISSIAKGDYPAQANHFADVPYKTEDVSNLYPALVGVDDPISTEKDPCVAQQQSINVYGLSQMGANRWARGNRCGETLFGESWSVRWTTAEQILFHYFTRVHLRDADQNKQILSPAWRWNPLEIDWRTEDNQPPVMNAGSTHSFEIQVQNTGINAWDCSHYHYQLGYHWLNGSSVIATGLGPSMCGLAPGKSKTDMLTVDVPPGLSGTYTLRLAMYEVYGDFWFSTGGWPPYDVSVQIISPTPAPTPTSCGFDGC